jgi:hypothetical protein
MQDSSLPGTYGKTRLVLLVVDPNLVHAYWEIAPGRLRDVKKKATRGSVVLRFYRENRESFDVEVDLEAPSWYVHLWSPEDSLFADLAVRMKDGTLIRLARSEIVHMPRTRPVIAIEQHFMKVDAGERRAELVPPPQVEHAPAREQAVPAANEIIPGSVGAPIDFAALVSEKLKPEYSSVEWRPTIEPETEPPKDAVIPTTEQTAEDLTEIAERSLTTGLSSGELPDRKK